MTKGHPQLEYSDGAGIDLTQIDTFSPTLLIPCPMVRHGARRVGLNGTYLCQICTHPHLGILSTQEIIASKSSVFIG